MNARKVTRFWSKVARYGAPDACWEWEGSRNKNGYGLYHTAGMAGHAHRLAYELAHGEVPDGFEVRHRCGNAACCRPDHLFVAANGTVVRSVKPPPPPKEPRRRPANQVYVSGEQHGRSKLTEAQVREIRSLKGKISYRALALQFGVSNNTIADIMNGKTWSHLGELPVNGDDTLRPSP